MPHFIFHFLFKFKHYIFTSHLDVKIEQDDEMSNINVFSCESCFLS